MASTKPGQESALGVRLLMRWEIAMG